MLRSCLKLFIAVFVLSAFVPQLCWCQEFRATITGVVTDSSKAVVRNASVTVRNLDTNEVRTVKTNGDGVYSIPYLLPAQRLEVSAEAPGFKKATYPPVVLTVSQKQTANFALQVGGADQTVIVNSEGYQVGLDTEKSDVGTLIDNKTMTQMPLNGRNALSLFDYLPGVTNEGGAGIEGPATNMYNYSFYTINGTPAQSSDYSIDGMPNNAMPWYSSSSASTVPTIDALQEFKVVTSPYDAQYGHTSSGAISMQLKSGTNVLHGSVYEFAKRGYMDANSWFNNYQGLPRGGHTEDQYGFEIDGPVRIPHVYNGSDKTFFMFSYEHFKEIIPVAQTFDVPNAAWLQGDFSNFVDATGAMIPVFDPATATTGDPTRQIFKNSAGQYNHVDPSRFNPIAVNIVKSLVSAAKPSSVQVPGQLPWEQIYINTTPYTAHSNNLILKIDQILGAKDHLSGNWIRSTNPSSSPETPPNVPWFNGSNFTEYHTNGGADWVHTFTSNLLTDVKISYQRYWRTDGPPAQDLSYDPTQLGFSSALVNQLPLKNGFPIVNFQMQQQAAGTGDGYNNWLTMSRDFYYFVNDTYSIAPSITWNKNKHSVRMGLDARDTHSLQTFQGNNFMQLTSNGIGTSEYWNQNNSNDVPTAPDGTTLSQASSGNAILDLLIGQPSSVGVTNQVFPYITWHYFAPWIQDDWKITPKLTLNLGFRYDLNGPPTVRNNLLNTGFDFNAVNPVDGLVSHASGLPTLKGGITFPGSSGTNLPWARDYAKWQPRLGFAWQPREGTVFRGGVGRTVLNSVDTPAETGYAYSPVYNNSPDGGRTYFPNNLGNPFPGGVTAIPGSSLGLLTNVGQGISFVNPHYKLPSVINGSFGMQQAMPHDGRLELSYVTTRGYGFNENYTALDTPLALYRSCNATLGTAANPYPQGMCQNLTKNPFQGVAGVAGSLGANSTTSLLQLQRPYPQFTGITETQNNWGRTWYNSLQTTYHQRVGWEQINASWTWSKTMQSGGYVDDVYLIPARSIAATDRQNRLTLTSVLNFPIGRGLKYFSNMNRPLDLVAGGWELATDAFWETGQPVALNRGYNVVGNIKSLNPAHSTPFVIDEGVNSCVQIWNNATPTKPGGYTLLQNGQTSSCNGNIAFQQTAPYGPTTSGSPSLSGPGYAQIYTDQIRGPRASQVDVNLSKNIKLTERFTMQLRMEEFNALNHPTWNGSVDMNPKDTNFGTVNKPLTGQSNNPRTGQLAVKVLW